ncbi:hypothetical protein HK096_008910 [Nowakowskiella sp. JEL0078]|nr:hypothetical protein HK096_008910 [Nowakowskiella sp. JEL0078]
MEALTPPEKTISHDVNQATKAVLAKPFRTNYSKNKQLHDSIIDWLKDNSEIPKSYLDAIENRALLRKFMQGALNSAKSQRKRKVIIAHPHSALIKCQLVIDDQRVSRLRMQDLAVEVFGESPTTLQKYHLSYLRKWAFQWIRLLRSENGHQTNFWKYMDTRVKEFLQEVQNKTERRSHFEANLAEDINKHTSRTAEIVQETDDGMILTSPAQDDEQSDNNNSDSEEVEAVDLDGNKEEVEEEN